LNDYSISSKLHKNKNKIFADHWSKHRKTAGSLSFLGGTAYNADIAQRCAALQRRSKKPLCIFHNPMLYFVKALMQVREREKI
jgi:hypothetical protein